MLTVPPSSFCLPGLALSGKPNHSFGSVVYGFSGSSWNVMILSMFFGHLAASSASGQKKSAHAFLTAQ